MNSIFPFAFIVVTIFPVHLSITVSQVCLIVSFENITVSPCENSIAPFFIILILTLILVTVSRTLLPKTLTLSKTIRKVSFEITFIFPIVISISMRLIILKESFVKISIYKSLNTFPMFQCILKFSFVPVTVLVNKYPITIRFAVDPLTHVSLTS